MNLTFKVRPISNGFVVTASSWHCEGERYCADEEAVKRELGAMAEQMWTAFEDGTKRDRLARKNGQ